MDNRVRAVAVLGVAVLLTACGGSSAGGGTSGSQSTPGAGSGVSPAAAGGSSTHATLKMTGQLSGPFTVSYASCPKPGDMIAQLKSPESQIETLSVSNLLPGQTTTFPITSATLAIVALRQAQLVWEASSGSGSGVVNVSSDGHSITFSVQLDPSKDPTVQHPTSPIGVTGTVMC